MSAVLVVVACVGPSANVVQLPHVAPVVSVTSDQPDDVGTTHVVFEGNRALSREALLAAMQSDDPGDFDADILERDTLLIAALYYDHGYVSVRVSAPVVTKRDDGVDVRIQIDEGLQYRIHELRIDERDANHQLMTPLGDGSLRARMRSQDGDWFNRSMIVLDLEAIRSLYRTAGFAAVQADPEMELDPKLARLDITIRLQRGPLVFVDSVVVDGRSRVSAARLRQAIDIADGSQYSETKLQQAKARLLVLGFSAVDVSTEAKPSDTRWTVTFELTE